MRKPLMECEPKPAWASKTVWTNILTVAIAILALATQQLDLSAQTLEWLLFGVGVLNILLRFVTNRPVEI